MRQLEGPASLLRSLGLIKVLAKRGGDMESGWVSGVRSDSLL